MSKGHIKLKSDLEALDDDTGIRSWGALPLDNRMLKF
jgi:hypothetical protein